MSEANGVNLVIDGVDVKRCPTCQHWCRADLLYEGKCFRCDKRRKAGFASARPGPVDYRMLAETILIAVGCIAIGALSMWLLR